MVRIEDYQEGSVHIVQEGGSSSSSGITSNASVRTELQHRTDCYSGYHQIALKKDDQIKTSFITPFGAYCYTTMSFGLKNAGATYQRAIQACLADEIKDDLVEAYVDDVVVKTKEAHTLVDNLKHTFAALNTF